MQRSILIAEDSPTQAERLRLLLEGEGYRVDVVTNGNEGLARIRSAPPDLIISDVVMPVMDGYDFCRAVKSSDSTKRTPFVLLTDQKTPLAIIKGLERGADNFITKPFDDDHLLERVRRIFEHLDLRRKGHLEVEVTVRVGPRNIVISADKQQIIELLFSTFEELCRLNERLEDSKRVVEEHAHNLEAEVHKRTEALRETNDFLSALIKASPAAITVLDADGNVTLWNPSAERIFGWQADEVVGRPLPTIPPEKREEHRALREQVMQEGRFKTIDVIRHKKDGSLIHINLSTAPLRDAKGDICGIMGIMVDITERKQLEEQLRQAQKMEAIGQLTGGIAHDFNNMLTVIMGYSELTLHSLRPDDPARVNVEQIEQAGERASLLTRQLLAFGRKQVLQPKVLDLNAVLTNLDQMLQRLIGEDIDLVTVLAPGVGRVHADPSQVEQVIMNLAVNARDAMPRGGKLTIETANVELDDAYARRHGPVQPGAYVLLAVSDTGCGMDRDTQARIFEPFFTTKEPGKGTGLGLSTVYGIVKQSGGYIWVYSEVGRGTTFKIYLPRVEAVAKAVEPSREATGSVRGSETILLVEDDAGIRALVRQVLAQSGYQVLEAHHGKHAIQICEQHAGPIHLLVTDMVMPEMSGTETAGHLTSLRPDLKVLFLSGYADEAVHRHGMLAAGANFLPKPFTPAVLARKVREVLDAAMA